MTESTKFEARNLKQIRMTEIPNPPFPFETLDFYHWNIFRISCLGFFPFAYFKVNGEHALNPSKDSVQFIHGKSHGHPPPMRTGHGEPFLDPIFQYQLHFRLGHCTSGLNRTLASH